ncbi:MAG TPA: putative metal-binding motif-containing protein [Polyangiaceae bacterium]|jgi:hypothetical protein
MTLGPVSRSILLGLLALAAAAGGAVAGCEAIVSTDVPAYTCSMTPFINAGAGTCPAGMYCKELACAPCENKDVCDGYDNDCDGIIDDGPASDHDGDGYTYCPKTKDGAKIFPEDCVDTDKTIYPGAKEVCNNKDDNCDGIIDNPDLVCPTGYTCANKLNPPQCIPNEVACDPNVCAQMQMICDPGTQKCVPNGTQDAGTTCNGDTACSTGICSGPSELGPTHDGGTCTKPCCTSADCDPGAICFGPGTGGNYCLDARSLGRTAPGAGVAGAACSGDGDCRSAKCASNKCEDTCCTNNNCTNGTSCAVTVFDSNTTLACIAPPGAAQPNGDCKTNADCASGYCTSYCDAPNCNDGVVISACAQPCCSSRQCGKLLGNQLLCTDDFFPPLQPPNFTPPSSGPVVPICDSVKQGRGTGNVGDPCPNGPTDCFSEQCAPNGMCTDVCCQDSDCAKTGWVCRPTAESTGTNLRCVPAP